MITSGNYHYEIIIEGRIDSAWSNWFDNFLIKSTLNNETILTGEIRDQSALFGILNKIRDLGMSLLLVKRLPSWEIKKEI